jgi:plasmid maintenance system antidote protein VapI
MATISEQIKNEIETCGATRADIARQTGIEESALSRFVHGERGLSMISIDILAEYFGYKLVKAKGK